MKNYDNIQELSDFLMKHNIKPSFQRVKILQRLSSKKDHPTVNQIYTDLVAQIPSLSKTTVYNTLNLFIKEGVARSINADTSESRYDLITSSHGHFLCNKCGSIYDFDITDNMNFDFLSKQGNEITSLDITIRGICKNCIDKK
ncbi:hypothetical protein HMPREF9630_01662 [Peptoanaerobacter stomatis]|uniref:Ferric uptake regulator family protein n=1 Tax=Peptoanaerobacter stomatis TaxID=796937 RepID=J6HRE2_9FIRM|nr:Fur family transcriptional regulator [Peptoanaerobacter stomatis]EHL17526.1 hypothetical protein HMPREF9630_01662 [Peptoanaerobacter stomatis]EJU24678.1 ferric uptake regulator family protein [Peptoanaerobacter stomatis]NWO25760.1 transcriptional repressor [Peptostreptococcaceae bacterium oral taxon 081]